MYNIYIFKLHLVDKNIVSTILCCLQTLRTFSGADTIWTACVSPVWYVTRTYKQVVGSISARDINIFPLQLIVSFKPFHVQVHFYIFKNTDILFASSSDFVCFRLYIRDSSLTTCIIWLDVMYNYVLYKQPSTSALACKLLAWLTSLKLGNPTEEKNVIVLLIINV